MNYFNISIQFKQILVNRLLLKVLLIKSAVCHLKVLDTLVTVAMVNGKEYGLDFCCCVNVTFRDSLKNWQCEHSHRLNYTPGLNK